MNGVKQARPAPGPGGRRSARAPGGVGRERIDGADCAPLLQRSKRVPGVQERDRAGLAAGVPPLQRRARAPGGAARATGVRPDSGRVVLALVLALVAVPEVVPAATHAGRITVPPDALVETHTLHLGDLAQLEGDALLLADVVVGEAPDPGVAARLSGNEILARLRAAGLDEERIEYRIPVGVRVVRAHRELDREELRSRIEERVAQWLAPGERLGRLEMHAPLRVPRGEIDVVVEDVSRRGEDAAEIRLAVEQGGVALLQRSVPARIEGEAPRVVFRRGLERGEMVARGDVAVEIRARDSRDRGAFSEISQVVGRPVRVDVEPGQVALRGHLGAAAGVRRGDPVRLELRQGSLIVTTSGEALENAALGDTVRIVNRSSGHELSGRVVGHGRIQIAF